MTASTTSLHAALQRAVDEAKLESARLVNGIRFAAANCFAGFYLISLLFFQESRYLASTWVMLLFWLASAGVWWGARRSDKIAHWSRFAIPFLDIPGLFVIQGINLTHSPNPPAVAAFSVALFVFMTVLSGATLETRVAIISGALALVGQLILNAMAGDLDSAAVIAHILLMVLAAVVSSRTPARRLQIVTEAAEKQRRRDLLARYFSPGVADTIEAREDIREGESCEVTVLFLDIRGFTSLIDSMDSAKVIGLLNEFFGRMVETIFRHGGTLDKYLGDGLMAYFNAPVAQADHAIHAVRAALEMSAELKALNERRRENGEALLRIGIGIHTGAAVVGSIGAPNRREYTAVGDTVNVAARMEQLTKEYDEEILLSEFTVMRIKGAIPCRKVAEAPVRGKSDLFTVYAP